MARRQPAGPLPPVPVQAPPTVVVDHGQEWYKPNPNRDRPLKELEAKDKGKAPVFLKDPNQPDHTEIVVTKKYRAANTKVQDANSRLVFHYNEIRKCKNYLIETAAGTSGKDKGEQIKAIVADLKFLIRQIPEKQDDVKKLNGHFVPIPEHLKVLPCITEHVKGRTNSKKKV